MAEVSTVTSWVAPSFSGVWGNGGNAVGCMKFGPFVHLRGLSQNVGGAFAFGQVMFTVPSSQYWPASFSRFSVLAFDSNTNIWKTVYIGVDNTNGQVSISSNSGSPNAPGMSGQINSWASMDGVTWSTV